MKLNEKEIQKRIDVLLEHLKNYYTRMSSFYKFADYDQWVKDNPQVEEQFLRDSKKTKAETSESKDLYFLLQFANSVLEEFQKNGKEEMIDQFKLIDIYKSMIFEFCVLYEYAPAFVSTQVKLTPAQLPA